MLLMNNILKLIQTVCIFSQFETWIRILSFSG